MWLLFAHNGAATTLGCSTDQQNSARCTFSFTAFSRPTVSAHERVGHASLKKGCQGGTRVHACPGFRCRRRSVGAAAALEGLQSVRGAERRRLEHDCEQQHERCGVVRGHGLERAAADAPRGAICVHNRCEAAGGAGGAGRWARARARPAGMPRALPLDSKQGSMAAWSAAPSTPANAGRLCRWPHLRGLCRKKSSSPNRPPGPYLKARSVAAGRASAGTAGSCERLCTVAALKSILHTTAGSDVRQQGVSVGAQSWGAGERDTGGGLAGARQEAQQRLQLRTLPSLHNEHIICGGAQLEHNLPSPAAGGKTSAECCRCCACPC